MFLSFHGVHSVRVQLPLLYFDAQYPLTPLPAVHWFSASGRVMHLKHGNLLLLAEIAAFPSQIFLPAALGSPEIRLSLSISHWIPPPNLTRQMVRMLSPFCFILVLVPPVFPISLLQLFPLDHPSLLAQPPLPLAAAVRGHQDLHLVSLESVLRQSRIVVSTHSSR